MDGLADSPWRHLPLEIRAEIFKTIFATQPVSVQYPQTPALMQVCTVLRSEAKTYFFEHTTFVLVFDKKRIRGGGLARHKLTTSANAWTWWHTWSSDEIQIKHLAFPDTRITACGPSTGPEAHKEWINFFQSPPQSAVSDRSMVYVRLCPQIMVHHGVGFCPVCDEAGPWNVRYSRLLRAATENTAALQKHPEITVAINKHRTSIERAIAELVRWQTPITNLNILDILLPSHFEVSVVQADSNEDELLALLEIIRSELPQLKASTESSTETMEIGEDDFLNDETMEEIHGDGEITIGEGAQNETPIGNA
ncbi:Hypothetical protein D9617_33g038030 [Elsinoe fawcettii]|nr:Hypothetical protein D9617_33g038030 [Elsinoe fawcettii]